MGSFWVDNAPTNTGVTGGNLGGFQPAPTISSPPQYQGPPIQGGSLEQMPQIGGSDPRLTTQPQPYQQGPTSGGSPGGGFIPFGGGIAKGPNGGFINPADGSPYQQGPNPQQIGAGITGAFGSLGQMGQHGGFAGAIGNVMTSPWMQQYLQQMGGRQRNAIQKGAPPVAAAVGNWMQGQSPQGGGFWGNLGSAISGAPAAQQPANPSQQSQQVQMQSPDGQHFQYVNPEHVQHYTGLGGTVVNGSSYGGGNG